MAVYTLRVGSALYSIGYIWQSQRGRPVSLARQNSRTTGYDCYCSIPAPDGVSRQIGLAHAGANLRSVKRSKSLAAALARKGVSLHAVVKVDQGTSYHCAIRDGEILPSGDVVGSDSHIDDIEQDHNEMTGIERATHYSMQEFIAYVTETIGAPGKEVAIKPVPTNAFIARRALLAFVPVFMLVGGAVYVSHVHQVEAEKAAQEKAALAEEAEQEHDRMLDERQRVVKAQQQHPWASIPLPSAFAAQCMSPYQRLHWSVDGWKFVDWLCFAGLNRTTAHYKPGTGAGEATVSPPLVYLDHGEASVYLNEAEGPASAVRDEPPGSLYTASVFKQKLYALLEDMGLSKALNLGSSKPKPQKFKAPNGREIALGWARYDFTIKTGQVPWSLADALDAIPGLRINQFTLVNQSGNLSWTLNGVAYVQAQ